MAEEVAELSAPTEPVVDAPILEVPNNNIDPEVVDLELEKSTGTPIHPLQPGGKRFEQIYAQNKQTQRDLAEEREKRIRAEVQLEILSKPKTVTKEYSVDELEAMIATGQITRADASRHREEVLSRSISDKLRHDQHSEIALNNRINALSNGIQAYLTAVPDVGTNGTVLKGRVDREFDWLASVQGRDPAEMSDVDRKALALTALRNVLGPVETLAKRVASPNADTHEGLTGGIPPVRRMNPDQKLLNDLKPHQVAHYRKMIDNGKYPGGWKDVVVELKFDPATRKR